MKSCTNRVLPFLVLKLFAVVAFGATAQTYQLPRHPEPFKGQLEPREQNSSTYLTPMVKAPESAPNILLVMTDDVGFGAPSTFGGSVPTPNLDKLAARGIRYNRFHTTGICSPTRAALLTGRNHHAVGMGSVPEMPSAFPGYTSEIPRSAATVARVLRDNGYNTAMFGKEHNVLSSQRSTAGPFGQWPLARGFEYFYGFVSADTNQWLPVLYEGNDPVSAVDRPDDLLLDEELADRTINWIHNQQAAAPDKPFFVYFATGSTHAPHHAPREWIEKFRGKFDSGWDRERQRVFQRQKRAGLIPPDTELSPRPDIIPAWDSLSAGEKAVYSRFMEVYAAQLAFQDAQFGRIMDELERMGIADKTLVVFIEGDNGASGEGGPSGTVNEIADLASASTHHDIDIPWLLENLDVLGGPDSYETNPIGWTYALSTPYPWFKGLASHLGAVRNGVVISWPETIKRTGEIRTQYHHVIDVMPTLLEAAGISAPQEVDGISQQPIDGRSMVYSFDAPDKSSPRTTQYYEMYGNRAIYHDGWLASTTPKNMPWNLTAPRESSDPDSYNWELYDLRTDFAQAHNLAESNPEKVAAMQKLFDQEARKYQVYPIQDSGAITRTMKMRSLARQPFQSTYTYWGKGISLPMSSSPPIFYLPFILEAEVEVPAKNSGGVIVAAGSGFGGWAFYLDDGRPVAAAAVSPLQHRQYRVKADKPLRPGRHLLRFEFQPQQRGGVITISVDGQQMGAGTMAERPGVLASSGETFDIGRDAHYPVVGDYANEGLFSGEIRKVVVSVKLPGAGGTR